MWRNEFGCYLMSAHLRQVDRQAVGKLAIAGPEALRLGGLRVPHDAGTVAEGPEIR